MATDQVIQAQAAVQEMFLHHANVIGVAVGNKGDKTVPEGEKAIVVLVERKLPLSALSAADVIPKTVDGIRTDVYEVGYLRAYQTPRDRFRPTIPSGVSMGHFKITAGTLGTIVTDRATGQKLILSNNHVLANSNDAALGDAILQPGPTDGGQNPGDRVATLERFVRLRFVGEPDEPTPPPGGGNGDENGGCLLMLVNIMNLIGSMTGSQQRITTVKPTAQAPAPAEPQVTSNRVDAAVARPLDPNMFTGEIRNIGVVSGTKAAALGMSVRKSGRTTDFTTGTVTLLNATVNVAYGAKTARFEGQVITTPMSQGGDSGSLIVDGSENKAVGLLFAGSPQATIFNPISEVLEALQINL
jgi:type IV secretory pathway TrbD component